MFEKYKQLISDFLAKTDKSTLVIMASGLLALALAVPLNSSVQADVTTLGDEVACYHKIQNSDDLVECGNEGCKYPDGSYCDSLTCYSANGEPGDIPAYEVDFSRCLDASGNERHFDEHHDEEQHPSADENFDEGPFHNEEEARVREEQRIRDEEKRYEEEMLHREAEEARMDEEQQKQIEREKKRLTRDFRWTLRELERAGDTDSVAEYEEFMRKVDACPASEWECVEDIRWELDDWVFEKEEELNSYRCAEGAKHSEHEYEMRKREIEREKENIQREFGKDALKEFTRITDEMLSTLQQINEYSKSCEHDKAEDLRFAMFDIEDKIRHFWEEWGDKHFDDFKGDRCEEMVAEIERAEREKLPGVAADKQEAAKRLFEKAYEAAENCDFEALHKLEREARALGLADDHDDDAGIRAYREVKAEDLKNFEHSDRLEEAFGHFDAEDDHRIYERIAKADRTHLNTILEEDTDVAQQKLRFIKNAEDQELINEFLKQQAEMQAVINQLRAELSSLKDEMAKYNVHGAEAERIREEIADDPNISEAQLKDKFERIKQASREAKWRDGIIPSRDMDDDHWATDAVKEMYDQGIVKGKSEGVYDPAAATTFAEQLKIVLETTGHGYSEGSTGVADYDHHWSKGYVKKAQELGIPVEGDINRPAVRGELAEIIIRAKGLDYENLDSPAFNDLARSHKHFNAVQTLKAKGVYNGSNGQARADDTINRAEIATFMNNVLDKL